MSYEATNGAFTPEQDNDKTNVEPVHSYDAFHTRSDMSGVKGIIGMHRFNICLVLSLSYSGVKTPLGPGADPGFRRGGGVRTGISGGDPNWCRALGKSTSKTKLQTAVGGGGGPMTPKKPLYPRMRAFPNPNPAHGLQLGYTQTRVYLTISSV